MEHILTLEMVRNYERHLHLEERSEGTIQKYIHDIKYFYEFLSEEKVFEKGTVIQYKEFLGERYAVNTANSMLIALNGLFSFLGWYECRVKPFKQQRNIFRDKERELSEKEYLCLLRVAKRLVY